MTLLEKYLGLTQILNWITCINNGLWSWLTNKLSMVDSDDRSASPNSNQDIWKV